MAAHLKHFFDEKTATLSYVVWDDVDGSAVVFDPVLNYDKVNCIVSHESVDEISTFLKSSSLNLKAIIETHVHADHWTGAQVLKKVFPEAKIYIGAKIKDVINTFIFLFEDAQVQDLTQEFDVLVNDGDELTFGALSFKALATPGHTPCCMSFYGHGMVFTGDALFMPDIGTGRCDFPGGDARLLYKSITEKIFTLPGATLVCTGHDYPPAGRTLEYSATVDQHKDTNVKLGRDTEEEQFVKSREERDSGLNLPALIFSSLQINMRAGNMSSADEQGRRFLKIPFWMGKK